MEEELVIETELEQKNDKSNVGKDGLKLTVSRFITLSIALVSAMLLSRFRTLEEYGTYSQILLVTNIVTSLLMLGLPNSINYFLARAESQEEKQKFLSVFYTLSTIINIVIGLSFVLSINLLIGFFDNPILRSFAFFLALYPWTKVIMGSIENVLVVYKKTGLLMIYRISNSLIVLLTIIISYYLTLSFYLYMILFLSIEVIFSLAVYLIVRKISGKLIFSLDKELLKKILAFSIPIGLASAVGTLNIELDKLIVSWYFNIEELAIYANAGKELPFTIIAASITAVLLPQLTRYYKAGSVDKALEKWRVATTLSYILISLIVAGVFVYAPDVLVLLYSEKYLPGLTVFRIYTLLLLLRVTYFGIMLNATGKTKFIFYSSLLALALNVILNFAFYHLFGFIGPAIATISAQFVINFAQLLMTSYYLKKPLKDLFPFKPVIIITLVISAFGVFFYYLKIWLPLDAYLGSLGESLVLGAVWSALFLGVMWKQIVRLWKQINE